MEEAIKDYNHAFQGPIPDVSVPVQCEEFIQIILAQEPDRTQLYFYLGQINFYAKQDFLAAERDFNLFLTKLKELNFCAKRLKLEN
jgi:hypothetical protein